MKGPIYLIDTDVFIDYLRGYGQAIAFFDENVDSIAISVITLSELYAGARSQPEKDELDSFSKSFPVYPITVDIAREGGLLKKQFTPSHGISIADALIAATAQYHELKLKTLNIKHYPMLVNLKPAYTKQ